MATLQHQRENLAAHLRVRVAVDEAGEEEEPSRRLLLPPGLLFIRFMFLVLLLLGFLLGYFS